MPPPYLPKVLIASDYFYPHWTGIAKAILNMIQVLNGRIGFTVLTVRYKKELKSREKIFGAVVKRVSYAFSVSRACYSPQMIFSFVLEVLRHDVVLINSPFTNVLPCTLIAKLLGRRVIIFHQGDLILPEGKFNALIENCFRFMTLFAMWLADTVSTYTTDYAHHSVVISPFLHKFTPLLMPVLPGETNGEKHLRLEPLRRQKEAGSLILGFAGRFVEEKGFDILLDAIPLIKRKIPHSRFAFAGETKVIYEKFFEQLSGKVQLLEKDIIWLGLLNDRELFEFYSLIDFIIVPSRSDCFNLVQAEACLAGKPSIVANIPGTRYLVQMTGFGKISKPEDANSLAQTVLQAAQQREKLMRRHHLIQSFFDTEVIADKLYGALTNTPAYSVSLRSPRKPALADSDGLSGRS